MEDPGSGRIRGRHPRLAAWSVTKGGDTTAYCYYADPCASGAPATGGVGANAVSYAYYKTGKDKSVTYPSYGAITDPTATYAYGPTGEMASVTDWLGNTTDFGYDADADLASIAYPDSTTDSITSDLTGETSGISLAPTARPTAPVATISYTRDPTELVTKETDTGDLSATPSYAYDESARLSTTGSHAVSYSTATLPETLPTGATATYNAAGQLVSATLSGTTTTYTYDSTGDRTKVAPTTGPTTAYGYDALGRLTSAESAASTGPLSGTGVRFDYDLEGLRVGETTATGTTTTVVWDTTTSTPSVLSDGVDDFVYGPSGQVVEQVTLFAGTPTYLVHDQLGSTRLLTNETGAVVGTYSYDAYGNETSHTGTATTPIGYAGGFETAATALVYLVNRYYTPQTGDFLSVDPTVATTTAPYVYATDDSVNGRDPTGLHVCNGNPVTWFGCVGNVATDIWNGLSAAGHALVDAVGSVASDTANLLGDFATDFYNVEAQFTADAKSVAVSVGKWVYAHRSVLATVGAIAICAAPGVNLVGCGIATAAAFAIRAQQRGISGTAFEADAVDLVLTGVSFGLIATPAAISLGEAPDSLYAALGIEKAEVPELSESAVQTQLVKLRLAAPDAIDAIVGQIEEATGGKHTGAPLASVTTCS